MIDITIITLIDEKHVSGERRDGARGWREGASNLSVRSRSPTPKEGGFGL